MTLEELQKISYSIAKEKGWYLPTKTPLEIHALIHSEIGEATEAARTNFEALYFSKENKPEGEAVELADAIIRIADYFEHRGWDLTKVVEAKTTYNKTRSYRHGNKLY